MIGVVANETHRPLVEEFFQLFKTPWEFARPTGTYQVLLVADGEALPDLPAKLILIYNREETDWDRHHHVALRKESLPAVLQSEEWDLALHAGCSTIEMKDTLTLMTHGESKRPVAVRVHRDAKAFVRVGYDVFTELRFLLTTGQPPTHARFPSLDRHIAFLRQQMLACGIAFSEIPPVPAGYAFTVCLSHDVDHPRLRFHGLDHTLAGFLARATVGSLKRLVRGRLSLFGLIQNWLSVLSLPFVYLRWARDPWDTFDKYLAIEDGLPSTFFVIPFADRPGVDPSGAVRSKRAARYGADAIRADLDRLVEAGKEVSLHGIDAWRDPSSGREEQEQVASLKKGKEQGVRMHWLYFSPESPRVLEEAGFTYDSTVGFNETIGLRAGTFQAYRPPGTETLLEMPLHVMDTALFYPDYLDLSPAEARLRVINLARDAKSLGGAVTVNWHDRSLAPERLWADVYKDLVTAWQKEQAWLTSLERAVAWFRWRRSFRFEYEHEACAPPAVFAIQGEPPGEDDLPDLVLRVCHPSVETSIGTAKFVDNPLGGKTRTKVIVARREAAVA